MTEASSVSPQEAVRLRGDPPQVMRLSRKAIGMISAGTLALIGGALIYALKPTEKKAPDELYDNQSRNVADGLANAPKDYGQVPKLGPALPGDLGRPILAAQQRGDMAALPPTAATTPAESAAAAARERVAQEREAARGSRLFFGGGAPGASAAVAAAPTLDGTEPSVAPPMAGIADGKRAFLDRAPDRRTTSSELLQALPSPRVLQAGSVIPAALITGIRSDLPGQITAQVTQNVYDSPTGRIVLVPQGARLIGDYDADVAFGQSRVLLVWNRLVLPDGRSLVLERQPGADAAGYAGLQDRTNYHWGGVMKGALISTLLGIGAEAGSGNDKTIVQALRRGGQDSISRAGDQIVSRELGIKPTLTIRSGFPVRVMVTRDLVFDAGQSQ